MQRNLISLAASACIGVVLAGCAAKTIDKLEERVEVKKVDAQKQIDSMRPKAQALVSYVDGSYIPLKKMKRPEFTKAQQKILATEIEINRNFPSLNEIASWLTTVVGYQVLLSPELLNQSMSAVMPSAPGAANMMQPAMMGGPVGMGAQSAQGGGVANKSLSVSYAGTVAGFLDFVAANYGVYWKIEGSNLRLLLTDSKTFRIKALLGDSQASSMVGSTASTSGAGATTSGSSNNSAGITFAGVSVWNGIESGIKQLLTPGSGKVAVSSAIGTVTVTDTPKVLENVEEFINEQNIALSRQVSVNVRVLSVEINDKENYGINWDAVYTSLSENAVFKMSSGFTPAQGAANFVLQTANATGSNWSAASGAMISALSMQGRVSELTSANVVTMNNQPAPVNVGRQVSYLASSATTTTTGAGNTTTLTPGQVSTGFSMVVVPHIIDGKELLLQSSINISSLLQLVTIASGQASIQTPDLSTSNFIQRVRMKSGDTLVVAGFDQDNLSAVSNGVGQAKNNVMGSQAASDKRTMLVVLIQPTVTN